MQAGVVGQVELMKSAFRYQNALVSYAYGLLRDRALAEDAVQEAFLVLMEKWASFEPEFGVFPWVRRMVYYKVQELSRARRRERPADDEELRELAAQAIEENFDEEAAEAFEPRLAAYEECVRKLGPEAEDLLVRYYGREESGRKIAGALRRSVNAVWLALSRIRKSLRECITRRCAEGAP
jgi:RNA polymerase sigma-70 factor (ECF subfamily)